ncbi:MAG: efflux transporter outer membrane subunit [Desulfosarcina sp.]|nr:efflux transporter outer membrane subunit [Desulfobacterales bacterium]
MKNEKFFFNLTLILLTVMLSSCVVFKPDLKKNRPGVLPEKFSLYKNGKYFSGSWWETFSVPELNYLIQEALSDNFSLKEAWARLDQVKASAVKRGSYLYPDLNVTADYTHTYQKSDIFSHTERTSVDNYSLGIASSYEIDLWGRIRSDLEAAKLDAEAAREDLNSAAMTLAAEVTMHWLNIIAQKMQKDLLEKQLQTNKFFLELMELRYRKSLASALDVFQQRQILYQIEAAIPLVDARKQVLFNELALLLGKSTYQCNEIKGLSLPVIGNIPDTGIPVDLLANRPDVRSSGLRLKASDWQVSAARADRLPAIRLTARASYGSDDIDRLFDNWIRNLAAGLVGPVFDGRRRTAEVNRVRAVAEERLASYKYTVLNAVKEVENSLVQEEMHKKHIKALELQLHAAGRALVEARERYKKGIIDYLPVLTQILAVQRLERELITQRTILVVYRVNLYRALGGDWTDELNREGLNNEP